MELIRNQRVRIYEICGMDVIEKIEDIKLENLIFPVF
jgi:hypothetical protein